MDVTQPAPFIDPDAKTKPAPDTKGARELHERAMKQWKRAEEWERKDRELAAEDLRFAAGGEGQWPIGEAARREKDGRPMITVNRLAASIKQVINDARQNRPGIKVIPSATDDPQHEKIAKAKADIYEGLVRQIEYASRAQQVYMPAYELMVRGGFRGSWRITTKWCDDDSFDQDIVIEPITSPFAVYRDPDSKQLDHSDDQFVFVVEDISKEAFEARWPKEDEASWDGGWETSMFPEWSGVDTIRVAEYWYFEDGETEGLALLDNGEVIEGKYKVGDQLQYPMEHEQYAGAIATVKSVRTVRDRKVMCAKLSGSRVLEPPREFPCKYIPIVSVEGPRQWVGDQMRHWSLIRDAKGPQILYNVSQTNIAERIGLAPKQPFIATATQVAGYEPMWANANQSTESTLLYNADPAAAGPPQRQMPAPVNQAEIQLAQQSIDDIKATMGIFDRSLGASSAEHSGRAILAVQAQGDNATFDFADMLAVAIGYGGRIIVDMIPRVMPNRRTVRTLNADDSTKSHVINESDENDLSIGRYDVAVVVGPSYATKRMESAEQMANLLQSMPQLGQIGADIIVKAQDLPGGDELAERFKKTLPPGMAKPEDGEEPPPPPPEPPPGPELLIKMRDTKSQVEYREAQAKKLEAETMALQLQNEAMAMQMAGAVGGQDAIRQMILETFAEMQSELGEPEQGTDDPQQGQQPPQDAPQQDQGPPPPDHMATIAQALQALSQPREPVHVHVGGGTKRMAIQAPSGAMYQGEIADAEDQA